MFDDLADDRLLNRIPKVVLRALMGLLQHDHGRQIISGISPGLGTKGTPPSKGAFASSAVGGHGVEYDGDGEPESHPVLCAIKPFEQVARLVGSHHRNGARAEQSFAKQRSSTSIHPV